MATATKIAWTDHTHNHWIGCAKVSRGCRFCYAEAGMKRWGKNVWGRHAERILTSEANRRKPYAWNRAAARAGVPALVFGSSYADVFEDHPALPPWRAELFGMVEDTPWLTWQLLTKRPENVAGMVPWGTGGWPPNVWIGASVESQRFAEQRVEPLRRLRGPAVKFLSCEPLVGLLDLDEPRCDLDPTHGRQYATHSVTGHSVTGPEVCVSCAGEGFIAELSYGHWLDPLNGGIGWVIVGGESGAKAARMDPAWAHALHAQCAEYGVPFFFKQAGTVLAREWGCADRKGADPAGWSEPFPQDIPSLYVPTGATVS